MILYAIDNSKQEVRLISLNEKSTALWQKYGFEATVKDNNPNNVPMGLSPDNFGKTLEFIKGKDLQNEKVEKAQQKPNMADFAQPINKDKKMEKPVAKPNNNNNNQNQAQEKDSLRKKGIK